MIHSGQYSGRSLAIAYKHRAKAYAHLDKYRLAIEDYDQALLIEVDREELVRRLAGRWICRACQTPYHEHSAPSAKPGVCDACGGELYQRDDDRPEVVGARLETYEKQTGPLAGYYERQGKLARIDGLGGIDAVAEKLGRAVGGRAAVAAAHVKVE